MLNSLTIAPIVVLPHSNVYEKFASKKNDVLFAIQSQNGYTPPLCFDTD